MLDIDNLSFGSLNKYNLKKKTSEGSVWVYIKISNNIFF